MEWIKERVWQLAIGVGLVLVGVVLAYLGAGRVPGSTGLAWAGLALILLGLAVPLIAKALRELEQPGLED